MKLCKKMISFIKTKRLKQAAFIYERENDLQDEIQKINEEHERTKDDYPTIDDIAFFIMENLNKYLFRSTVKIVINDRIQGSKIVKVKEIEDNRYDYKYDGIKDFYQRLAQEVRILFSLDESGQN